MCCWPLGKSFLNGARWAKCIFTKSLPNKHLNFFNILNITKRLLFFWHPPLQKLKGILCPEFSIHTCWLLIFHHNALQKLSLEEDFQETYTIKCNLLISKYDFFWPCLDLFFCSEIVNVTSPKKPRQGWWLKRAQSASPRNWLPTFSFKNYIRQIK